MNTKLRFVITYLKVNEGRIVFTMYMLISLLSMSRHVYSKT